MRALSSRQMARPDGIPCHCGIPRRACAGIPDRDPHPARHEVPTDADFRDVRLCAFSTTALHYAAICSLTDISLLLLTHGAAANMPDSEGCVVSLNGIRVRICRMRILMIEKGIRNARCYGEETRLSSVHALTHCGSSQPRFPSTVRLFRNCVPLFLINVTLFRNCVPPFLIYVPLLSSVSLLASLPQQIRR
jgi:hypothetical protein